MHNEKVKKRKLPSRIFQRAVFTSAISINIVFAKSHYYMLVFLYTNQYGRDDGIVVRAHASRAEGLRFEPNSMP